MTVRAQVWIDALSGSTLFRGAELRTTDLGGVEISRGSARALVLPVEQVPDADAAIALLDPNDCALLLVGAPPQWLERVPADRAPLGLLTAQAPDAELCLAAHGLLERVELRRHAVERGQQLTRYRYERGELVEIARAITRERDIDRLLSLILEKSRYITGADAGSLYVVEGELGRDPNDHSGQRLHFKLSQNDSIDYASREFEMPVSTDSIAGAAVVTRQAINISDVYDLPADVPYRFDRSFDERMSYRTVSMLAVPMISAEDEVIGVIQLINKKRDPRVKLQSPEAFAEQTMRFDARSEELLGALAAQAGIALENALLYAEIRTIFEGFVRASVQAIEQRDPTTSGHSQRVSVLSCRLAEAVERDGGQAFGGASFSLRDLQELKYAALLHDFGKIGVREQVLVKAKKLYPHERDAIASRIELALRAAEVELLQKKLQAIESGASEAELAAIQLAQDVRRDRLIEAWALVERADEPSVMSEGDFSRINELLGITYADGQGREHALLTESEAIALRITRGSLSPAEIEEIRSHVVHTYNFLAKIPWGPSMRRIPEIAAAHHEKLNGTGYPSGALAAQIPLQSKIMTVADIYDALTAADRPYKKALPAERALQILGFEVKEGNLDPELVRVFREAEIFKRADETLSY
ncbi:MAG TPA: HD domain-containing phosphohydrolase [Polyangiales bacterium]|nr:HD domain-containing phosphohydrolase [Polyangiales bacterium]